MKLFTSHGNKSRHIKTNNCKAKSIIHSSNNNITPNVNINGNNNINGSNNNIINNNYINNCLIKKNGEWKITNIENLSNNLINKNSNEIRNYYNNYKTKINNSILDIDLIEFIFKKFNYLDLCLDKKLYTNIKDEIK
jgi:hypothetical protein